MSKPIATAAYLDTYAGEVAITLVPAPRNAGFWWKTANGEGIVVGGQNRPLPAARAIAYAKWHRSYSNVQVAA
jgi:hypothetical protein